MDEIKISKLALEIANIIGLKINIVPENYKGSTLRRCPDVTKSQI